MTPEIDASLYPDCDAPTTLEDVADAAEYLARVCGAFEFGIPPSGGVLAALREQRDMFDRFPLAGSPAYHTLRRMFGWPSVPALVLGPSRADQRDCGEGRGPDDTLI